MEKKTNNPINLRDISEIEALQGIFRSTLSYNKDGLLCHFRMLKGAKIPLHDHVNTQIGYVISGKIRFLTDGADFIASSGDSYVFNSYEKHGAEILEDTLAIEVFIPIRPEYIPKIT